MENKNIKNEIIQPCISIEPVSRFENDIELEKYISISFSEISALGVAFSALPKSFNSIAQTVNDGDVLYKAVTANGNPMTLPYMCKNGLGFSSGYMLDGKLGSAHFIPVGETSTLTSTPFNPAGLFMAVALASIERKLCDIQEVQQEILDFLQDDKRSQLKGNLNFLTDILNNYKYNSDNSTYKTNMHIKTQDIKQDAEHNINFYKSRINKQIKKRSNILTITDQNVKAKLKSMQSDFQDYQLSLYLYGFSSFLEVMLLENFDKEFLASITKKIEDYSNQYRELYTICYDELEENSKNSLQTALLSGLANISGAAGEVVSKIPVVSKSQLDES